MSWLTERLGVSRKRTPANQTPDYWRQQLAAQQASMARQAQQLQPQADAANSAWRGAVQRAGNYYNQPGLNQQEQAGVGARQAQAAWDAEQGRSQAAAAYGRAGVPMSAGYQGAVQGSTNAQMLAGALAQRDAYQQAAARQAQGASLYPALAGQFAQAQYGRYSDAQNSQMQILQSLLDSYLMQQQQRQQRKQSDQQLLGQLAAAVATL